MNDREILIRNLFRQVEKSRLQMINQLLYKLDSLLYTTKQGNLKITMIINIEKEEN